VINYAKKIGNVKKACRYYRKLEKEKPGLISRLILFVNPKGLKSNQFLDDLKRINALRGLKLS